MTGGQGVADPQRGVTQGTLTGEKGGGPALGETSPGPPGNTPAVPVHNHTEAGALPMGIMFPHPPDDKGVPTRTDPDGSATASLDAINAALSLLNEWESRGIDAAVSGVPPDMPTPPLYCIRSLRYALTGHYFDATGGVS